MPRRLAGDRRLPRSCSFMAAPTRRLAAGLRADWLAVYVETSADVRLSPEDRRRIEGTRISDRKQRQVHFRTLEIKRRQISVLRKPDGIGQSDKNCIVIAGKRLGVKNRVAQSARLPLHCKEDFGGVIALGEVADDV